MRWMLLISSGHFIQMQKIGLRECTWNVLQDRPHLGSQTNLSKFTNFEIMSSIFSDHNPMRQHINLKEKKNCKKHKHMEIKPHFSK